MKFNQLTTNYVVGIDLHKSPIAVHILSKNDRIDAVELARMLLHEELPVA